MGHNCVPAILTLLHGLQALVILAGALAGHRPGAQLFLMCLLWLPDASIVHLTFTSESQISSLSLHPLLLVQHPDVEGRSLCTCAHYPCRGLVYEDRFW